MMSSSDHEQERIDSSRSYTINQQIINIKSQKSSNPSPKLHSTFHKLKRNDTNLFNQDLYSDDHFKLQEINLIPKTNRKISIIRLKDIITPGSQLFGDQLNFNLYKQFSLTFPHSPGFICQMHILPFWHYETLIEPKNVNQKGFYHVVICKDGRMIKQTIDDTFYFDQVFKKIYSPYIEFQSHIWMHIILKVWAKHRGGYSNIADSNPFDFIRTFSYPDWKTLNPALEDIQKFINKINHIRKGQIIAIASTKNDKNVGLYGLIPNSAGYLVTGHYMEFEAIFIRVRALNGCRWNGLKSHKDSANPEDKIILQENEFIIPIRQFLNLFKLVHLTTNKFLHRERIFYTRYSLNLDARQSKAKMILIEINNFHSHTESTTDREVKDNYYNVNLNFYFPYVRAYDLSRQKTQYQTNDSFKIPFAKLIFGRQQQTTNHEASFVQSMKEMMLENQDEDFLYGKETMQYEWIQGTYFKGYDHSCTFLLKLKPGRYLLRFKIQTLRVEYRTNINIVSETPVRISDPKMDKKEQQQFLRQMLSSKARLQKRNINYLNPIKKGSWYVCNNDFKSIGYGYLVFQSIKSSEYRIEVRVDQEILKSSGYKLKQKKDKKRFTIVLKEGEGQIIILKVEDGYEGVKSMRWPPQGIQIMRIVDN